MPLLYYNLRWAGNKPVKDESNLNQSNESVAKLRLAAWRLPDTFLLFPGHFYGHEPNSNFTCWSDDRKIN